MSSYARGHTYDHGLDGARNVRRTFETNLAFFALAAVAFLTLVFVWAVVFTFVLR